MDYGHPPSLLIYIRSISLIFLQVFRSIDSGSVKGFPRNVVEAEKQVQIHSLPQPL